MILILNEIHSGRTREVYGRPVPTSHLHTLHSSETQLPLSLGKRLECRKGKNTLKGEEGRIWVYFEGVCVCMYVCIQNELKQRQHERDT